MRKFKVPAGYRIWVELAEPDAPDSEYNDIETYYDAIGNLKTKHGNIVLKTAEEAKKDRERKQRAQSEARVVAVGSSAFSGFGEGDPWCSVGDWVLIPTYCGQDHPEKTNGMVQRIINDEDIIAVLEDSNE